MGVRAKRSAQRWSQRGLSFALHLRAIHDSDRFDRFWRLEPPGIELLSLWLGEEEHGS